MNVVTVEFSNNYSIRYFFQPIGSFPMLQKREVYQLRRLWNLVSFLLAEAVIKWY